MSEKRAHGPRPESVSDYEGLSQPFNRSAREVARGRSAFDSPESRGKHPRRDCSAERRRRGSRSASRERSKEPPRRHLTEEVEPTQRRVRRGRRKPSRRERSQEPPRRGASPARYAGATTSEESLDGKPRCSRAPAHPRKQSRPAWRERPQGPPRQVEGAASCHGLYASGRSRSGSRERSREPPRGLAGAVSKKPAYGQPEQPRLQQRQQPLRQQHAAQPQPEPYTSGWAARSEQPFALVTAVTGAPEGPRTEVIAGCLYHGSDALHTTHIYILQAG